MAIDMDETRLSNAAQLSAFWQGNLEIEFRLIGYDVERHGFIAPVPGYLGALLIASTGETASAW